MGRSYGLGEGVDEAELEAGKYIHSKTIIYINN